MHTALGKGIALVQRLAEADAPVGRHEGEDGVYAMVQEYTTRQEQSPRFENHSAYIDVQILVSGTETVLAGAADVARLTEAYTPDAEFYAAPEATHEISLRPGVFAVFFPGDAHAPGLAAGTPTAVKKIVGKIPV